MSCVSDADCNNRGYCIDGECDCDPGWFDPNCVNNLEFHYSRAFNAFRVIFLILFSVIILAVLLRLIFKTLKESRIYSQRTLIIMLKGFRSPYNIVCLLIFLLCLTQILWLAIDPLVYKNILSRASERFLYEASFILLFIMYAIILWVWHYIYEELSERDRKTRRKKLLWVKIGLLAFIIFAVGVLIAVSLLKNSRSDIARHAVIWLYVVLFIIQVIFLVAFAAFGVRLYRRIHAKEKDMTTRLQEMGEPVDEPEESEESRQNRSKKEKTQQKAQEKAKAKDLRAKYGKSHTNSIPEIKDKSFELVKLPRSNTAAGMTENKENIPSIENLSEPPLERLRKATSTVITQPLKQRNRDDVYLAEPKKVQVIFEEDENEMEDLVDLNEEIDTLAKKLNHRLTRAMTTADVGRETKIKEILKRDRRYFQALERSEFKDDIAMDVPLIVGDVQGVVWDVPDEEEQQRVRIKREINQENKEALCKQVRDLRASPQLTEMTRKITPEIEIYQRMLLEDPEYLRHHRAISKSDRAVIKRITALTIVAIFLGVLAAVINLINYLTESLSSAGGVIVVNWIMGLLLIFAVISVVMLFSLIDTQEKENLRLIYSIGKSKNRINKLYAFVLPDYMREEESKKKLENNINYLTTRHTSFLDINNNK